MNSLRSGLSILTFAFLVACTGAPRLEPDAPGFQPLAGGQPVINEVYYDSPSTDTGTFIEIKGAGGTSLSGYSLVAYNTSGSSYATINLSGSIPASGYYVVAQDTTVPNRNLVNTNANLFNTSTSLHLKNGSSIVDRLAYGNPGVNLGEGSSAGTAGGSVAQGLSRTPDGADTDDNATDFKAKATTPGSSNGGTGSSGKLVLFDLTKREDAGNADWRIDGAYSSWADALRSQGYTVQALTGSSVTSTALGGASAFVVAEPQNPFSDTERSAIQSFVQNGGGLLMISDHRVSDRDNDGWDSPEVFNGWDGSSPGNPSTTLRDSLNTDSIFGLGHSFNSSFSDPVYTIVPLTTHPVLNGVSSAGIYVGTSIDVNSGTALMGVNGKTYLAANTVGSGRVLAYGDSSAFSDATFSNGSTSQYNNWVNLSNAKLAVNMIQWLAKDLN
jgi:Lamin Tail Domain